MPGPVVPLRAWIAFEFDEYGQPSQACLIVVADTRSAARDKMAAAIAERSEHVNAAQRRRIWDIFIESPQPLPNTDARAQAVEAHGRETFLGFDPPLP